jgi:hypothetical protein
MALVDFSGSRSERPAKAARSGTARIKRALSKCARSGARPVLEIGATLCVLTLLMISGLAVRFLLLLPIDGLH